MEKKKKDLFLSDDNPKTNALLNVARDSEELYIKGYYNAACELIRQILAGRGNRHEAIYPIVYLYRHYFELRLKHLAARLGIYLGVPIDIPGGTHSLTDIWTPIRPLLKKSDLDFGDEPASEIEEVITSIEQIDRTGETFRYAKKKSGASTINEKNMEIGLENLRDVVYNAYWMLEGLAFTIEEKLTNRLHGNI